MNRRSFFTRAFSAIVAARMARELSAVELRVIPCPHMLRLRNRVRDIELSNAFAASYMQYSRANLMPR